MSPPRTAPSAYAVAGRASGFAADYLRGDPRATRFLPRHPSRSEDFAASAKELEGRVPAGQLWARAEEMGARLGAPTASLENARRLAKGEALCVTTGQQPGLLLGPLYTLYKAMTAVRLAAAHTTERGRPVVPVFWIAGDDSDFAEVASTLVPGQGDRLERRALAGGTLPAGGMVGNLATSETADIVRDLAAIYNATEHGRALLKSLERACERARDHGEIAAALLLEWLGPAGLVVVDGRWPELRVGARALFERWLDLRSPIEDAVLVRGRELEEAGYRAPLTEASIRTGLFDASSGLRLPFEGSADDLRARIREAPESLSPNVVLRSAVQDALLPNLATIAGPSEIAYHAQLIPVYERLELSPPVLVPRFEATLVPSAVVELAARRGAPLEDFVFDFDGAMKATAARAIPPDVAAATDALAEATSGGMTRLRDAARAFDPKLGESLAESERRLAETVQRARERIIDAAREAERRRDPALRHAKDYLAPFRLPQERALSAIVLPLSGGAGVFSRLGEVVDCHWAAVKDLHPAHFLLERESLADPEAR